MAFRIEDYALIGNCETAALAGRESSVDWREAQGGIDRGITICGLIDDKGWRGSDRCGTT